MKFTKMHGLGNDFIILDAWENDLSEIDFAKFSQKHCHRNFGIGADGVLVVEKSSLADAKMRIYNADGSEPEMCGNGIRCFAKYLYDKNEIKKEIISIETLAGIKVPALLLENGKVSAVEVDMGEPLLLAKNIPINIGQEADQVIAKSVNINGQDYSITTVSMGNPHCVIFVEDVLAVDVIDIGSSIETADIFPEKTNVEFIQIVDRYNIMMRVWERGVGETLACGTGACAAVVASVLNAKTERKVIVQLGGGSLQIDWQESDNHVYMTGPAVTVFSGSISNFR